MVDAETGQRGFIVTGEEKYLEPYAQAINVLAGHVKNLRELTSDNQNQQKRISLLEPVIAERLNVLAEVIALRRQRGMSAAAQAMLTDKGKDLDGQHPPGDR